MHHVILHNLTRVSSQWGTKLHPVQLLTSSTSHCTNQPCLTIIRQRCARTTLYGRTFRCSQGRWRTYPWLPTSGARIAPFCFAAPRLRCQPSIAIHRQLLVLETIGLVCLASSQPSSSWLAWICCRCHFYLTVGSTLPTQARSVFLASRHFCILVAV